MKFPVTLITFVTLLASTVPALAFDTGLQRIGMLYVSIPLTSKSVLRSTDTAVKLRLGSTGYSSDHRVVSVQQFNKNPAMLEVEFRPKGYRNAMYLGLQDFRLNGISALEKEYLASHEGPVITGFSTGVFLPLTRRIFCFLSMHHIQ